MQGCNLRELDELFALGVVLCAVVSRCKAVLFSKVDRKHKIPLFLFSFFVKPFSKGTQNQKWGQIFYVSGF